MLENVQKLSIEFDNLDKVVFPFDIPFMLTVDFKGVKYELYVRLKEGSERLLVLGSGAYNSAKMSPPIFQRHTWVNKIEGSVIFYNDPTLYLGKMNLGWGQGTGKRFYLEELGEILEGITNKLDFYNSDLLFYGSSAGGFMSMYLAGIIKGSRAIVNNPQTIVSNYYQTHVQNMYSHSYKGLTKEEIESSYIKRLSIIDFYKDIKYIPEIHYVQNLACSHDVKFHFTPLINMLKTLNNTFDITKVSFDLYYNQEQGHEPLDQLSTLDYLNNKK